MLPLSRDITLSDFSPVPHTLLNTLEDCVVGGKRGQYIGRPLTPFVTTAMTGQLVGRMPCHVAGAGAGSLAYQLNGEIGEQLLGMTVDADVLGSGLITLEVSFDTATALATTGGSGALGPVALDAISGWHTSSFNVIPTPAFVWTPLVTASVIVTVPSGNTGVKIGPVRAILYRP